MGNDGNYIKIFRGLLEWEWYQDINTKTLFLHMLLKANWKEGKFQGTTVPRGSFVSSIKTLAMETSLTEREIRTGISHLKSTGEVTSRSTNKFTVFTVVNYNLYQAIDRQDDNQPTSERHSNDKRTTTIEERKKERREEDNNNRGKKNATVFPPDSFEMKCVDMLITALIENYPGSKVPDTDEKKYKWCKQIEYLKRLDKRSEDDIWEALTYATTNSFWKTNIRSTEKLRDQFETLILQARNKGGKNQNQSKNQTQKPKNQFQQFPQREIDYDAIVMQDILNMGEDRNG